ncbi:uncharacterized protein LDX57_009591 [Aspergillus melleus]|uniref:uncharacterized protein n=1 Tax=Aspergillus melleus TaxID=138277 RepID=UPI001E8EF081|nr:uncharacterized protein LDX57_009591 [Aspergillus melleus]KAH8431942.1 hypothetical protein LDX57_009591 [Aspergillus melleus]
MQFMDSILVTECTGGNADSGAYWLQHVDLDVQAYQLHMPFEQESFQTTDDLIDTSEDGSKAKVVTLPCKELDGLWESYELPWFLLLLSHAHAEGRLLRTDPECEQTSIRRANPDYNPPRSNQDG